MQPDSERSEVWNTGKEMKEMSMRTAREPGEEEEKQGDGVEVEEEEEEKNEEPRWDFRKTFGELSLGMV